MQSSHTMSNFMLSFLANIVWMNESQGLVRPLRAVITSSSSSRESPMASSCSLNWDPCEVVLDGFSLAHLGTLQLSSQIHLSIDVSYFIHFGYGMIHLLWGLLGWQLRKQVVFDRISNDPHCPNKVLLVLLFRFILFKFCNFFLDVFGKIILSKNEANPIFPCSEMLYAF